MATLEAEVKQLAACKETLLRENRGVQNVLRAKDKELDAAAAKAAEAAAAQMHCKVLLCCCMGLSMTTEQDALYASSYNEFCFGSLQTHATLLSSRGCIAQKARGWCCLVG